MKKKTYTFRANNDKRDKMSLFLQTMRDVATESGIVVHEDRKYEELSDENEELRKKLNERNHWTLFGKDY